MNPPIYREFGVVCLQIRIHIVPCSLQGTTGQRGPRGEDGTLGNTVCQLLTSNHLIKDKYNQISKMI